jgi:hypothetical protein
MKLIATLSMLLATVLAQNKTGPVDWETSVYDEEQYFKDIPDLVNMTDVAFKFKMANRALTGFE